MQRAFFAQVILGLLVLLTLHTPAMALTIDEVRTMSRTDDVAALENAFNDLAARVAAGEESTHARDLALAAFYTSDPRVETFVDEWLRTFPDSPHALSAKAAMVMHLAAVVRGDLYVSLTPPNSMRLMHQYHDEARPLIEQVLQIDPTHTFAASLLETLGTWGGDRRAAARGVEIIEQHGSGLSAFRRRLSRTYPQWGGGRGDANLFCAAEAPKQPDITLEQCRALVVLQAHGEPGDPDAAIATLMTGDGDKFTDTILSALIAQRRGEEALALVREHDLWVSYTKIRRLQQVAGDRSLLIEFSRRWLDVNPNHPVHLTHLAEGLAFVGDMDGAIAAIDRAAIHGPTIPEVRRMQLELYKDRADKHDAIYETVLQALDDTNWHPHVYGGWALFYFEDPEGKYAKLLDGTPRPRYQCQRAEVLGALRDVCEYWSRAEPYFCADWSLERTDELVAGIDTTGCD